MKYIKQYLQLWKETSDGTCVPITADELIKGIQKINTEDNYLHVIKKLRQEGYICATISGEYQLTDACLQIWKKIPHTKQKAFTQTTTGREWTDFRNLMSYYIECAKLEEVPTHVFYDDNEDTEYFMPKSIPCNWLKNLDDISDRNQELVIKYDKKNQYIINKFKTHFDDDEAVFIGYPIIATKTLNGNLRYVPVGVIPVKVKLEPSIITTNSSNTITLIPDFFQAKINHAVLNLYIPKNKEKSFLKMVNNTHPNGEYVGLFDLRNAINIIEKAFTKKNNDDEKLHPEMLSQFIPRNLNIKERRLCNTLAIYTERDFKYSKVLIKELQYIKNSVSDRELDNTSLAYIYRNPPLKHINTEKRIGINFIQSNSEQITSLEHALNNPTSKITGPPGTGKSQVATNIIANSIYYNESVLFTSKNHKAVSAIRQRSQSLFKDINENMYLTEFCHDETEQLTNQWYKKDLETSISNNITFDVKLANSNRLQRDMNLLSNFRKMIDKDDVLLNDYYESLDLYYKIKNKIFITTLCEEENLPFSGDDIKILKDNVRNLKDCKNTIIGKLIWKFRDEKVHNESIKKIKETVPSLFEMKLNDCNDEQIKSFIIALINDYHEYIKARKQLEKSISLLKENSSDLSIKKKIENLYSEIDNIKYDGYFYNQNTRVSALEEDENLLKSIDAIKGKYWKKNSVNVIERNGNDAKLQDEVYFKHFLQIHPSWAVTLLSLQYSSPCLPGIFDRVIIDEAAQCDCISIIPALFRAKSAVVMGDPQQLPPILSVSEARNEYFFNKYNLSKLGNYNYLNATAFSVVKTKGITLKEHFRCAPEIAEIFDDYFYGNELRTRTDVTKLNFPSNCGFTHAVEWIDIKDSFEDEIDAAVSHVKKLIDNNYKGSIGVISPLRVVVNTIKDRLNSLKIDENQVLSKTVASFQGNECDIIIFVVAYNREITHSEGKKWYLTDKSNQYIYNVAISRAKALLLLIGDREACRSSKVKILEKLANSPKPKKKYEDSEKPVFESPWETKLYYALKEANIQTKTQVPLVGRRLDLAYMSDDFNLDIEVDGMQYHSTKSGHRKMDDIFRDMQIEAAGWFVIRFWVFELQEDMEGCVKKVKEMIELKGYPDIDDQ
jgi:superfamily I DNA and/or RNA helicase/very-short-patch-repair endonuclease